MQNFFFDDSIIRWHEWFSVKDDPNDKISRQHEWFSVKNDSNDKLTLNNTLQKKYSKKYMHLTPLTKLSWHMCYIIYI